MCCANCLYFQAFPRYMRVGRKMKYEGFCRRPELYASTGSADLSSDMFFVNLAHRQVCPQYYDADSFYRTAGLGAEPEA